MKARTVIPRMENKFRNSFNAVSERLFRVSQQLQADPAAGHKLLQPPAHLQQAGLLLQEALQPLGHDDAGEAGPDLLQGDKHAARARLSTVLRRVARVPPCSSSWFTRKSVARQLALQSDRTLYKNGARRYSSREGGIFVIALTEDSIGI